MTHHGNRVKGSMTRKPGKSQNHKAIYDLSKVVRNRREALGLTQKELAEYAGCGVVFIYDIETSKPSVRMDKLVDVLTVLGLALRVELGTGGIEIAAEIAK